MIPSNHNFCLIKEQRGSQVEVDDVSGKCCYASCNLFESELYSNQNYQQVSQSALCRAVQDGFLLPELPNFMQYYTSRHMHIIRMHTSSACHPHAHVIHTCTSSTCHLHTSSAPACHSHVHMSSTHHLQHSSWSAWT